MPFPCPACGVVLAHRSNRRRLAPIFDKQTREQQDYQLLRNALMSGSQSINSSEYIGTWNLHNTPSKNLPLLSALEPPKRQSKHTAQPPSQPSLTASTVTSTPIASSLTLTPSTIEKRFINPDDKPIKPTLKSTSNPLAKTKSVLYYPNCIGITYTEIIMASSGAMLTTVCG